MFHVHDPHAVLPLARGMPHIRALSAGVRGLGGAAGLCPRPGSVLGGGRARDRADSAFPDGPRSRLAAKRGLTINFYWRSALCTVRVPCPVLRSGPEEVPFGAPKAKQMTAPYQAGCCTPAHWGGPVAICCLEERLGRDSKGLRLAPW